MVAGREVEIEVKVRLDSFTDYLKLIGFLGPIDLEEHHTSAFFDSADRKLGTQGYALRVRAEDRRGLVTVKSLLSQREALAVRREIEAEIDTGQARQIIRGQSSLADLTVEPIKFIRRHFPKVALHKVVQFENQRQKKRFLLGDYEYTLEIDRTEFADGSVDYELEVELQDESQFEVVEDRLRKIFTSLNIPFEKETRSKYARALERSILL